MRLLLPLLVSLQLSAPVILSSTPLPADRVTAAPVSAQWIENIERSLVRVTTGDGVCTGWVVDAAHGWAMTARHCVVQNQDVFIDGKPTTILKVDEVFALLAIPPMSKPPLDLRKGKVIVGESVVVFGYGYGWMQVMQRHVTSLLKGDVFLDGSIAPGMSGGPTVDLQGRVVGLNQAVDQNYSLAQTCGPDEIRAFLKDVADPR